MGGGRNVTNLSFGATCVYISIEIDVNLQNGTKGSVANWIPASNRQITSSDAISKPTVKVSTLYKNALKERDFILDINYLP